MVDPNLMDHPDCFPKNVNPLHVPLANCEFSSILVLQGNDPCRATCRGSLQSRRSQLNREIHREMRLRAGAENLLR